MIWKQGTVYGWKSNRPTLSTYKKLWNSRINKSGKRLLLLQSKCLCLNIETYSKLFLPLSLKQKFYLRASANLALPPRSMLPSWLGGTCTYFISSSSWYPDCSFKNISRSVYSAASNPPGTSGKQMAKIQVLLSFARSCLVWSSLFLEFSSHHPCCLLNKAILISLDGHVCPLP